MEPDNTAILKKLDEIERGHKVRVVYACESGSRAWGFPSKDSDFDVRFIYVHEKDWYLSINQKRDVIEFEAPDKVLDISGWDIRKAFILLRKSNMPLFEWLSSPIIYKSLDKAIEPLAELVRIAFLPGSACYHYLGMAKNMKAKIEDASQVRHKTYLYALRPLLCCKWIIHKNSPPPVLFSTLLETYLPKGDVRDEIDRILESKRNSSESDTSARTPVLDIYIRDECLAIEQNIPKNGPKSDIEIFDEAFREILGVVNRL